MTSIRVHWNPNDTPDRSSLLSLRLKNARPLTLASNKLNNYSEGIPTVTRAL